MITCPNCKTANRDGSRFCNVCGASLVGVPVNKPRTEPADETAGPAQDAPALTPTPDSEMPAWLRELRDAAQAAPPEAFAEPPPSIAPSSGASPSGQTSERSSELESAQGTADGEADAEVLPTPKDEIPDWLREFRARGESPGAESSTTPAAASSAGAAPASGADFEREEEPHAEAVTEDDVPAWLRDLQPTDFKLITSDEPPAQSADESSALTEPLVAKGAESGDVPDWLKQLRESSIRDSAGATRTEGVDVHAAEPPDTRIELAEATEGETPAAEVPVPEWLADLGGKPVSPGVEATAVEPAGEPAQTPQLESTTVPSTAGEAPDLVPGETPEWLKGLTPTPAQPAEWELSDVAVNELPDWLKPSIPAKATDETTAVAGVPAPAPAAAPVTPEGLAPGEIPAWVQALKPGTISTPAGEMIETSGLLAGIRGALPVESVLSAPHHRRSPSVTPAGSLSGASQAASRREPKGPVAGFTELSTPHPSPPVSPAAPKVASRKGCGLQLLVALAIVLAVTVAFLPLPLLADLRGINITGRQPTLDFYQTINQIGSLRQSAVTLVGFDYGAGARAELDPQARAAILHLFQNKQRVVAVSFVPEGGQIAQETLDSARPAGTGFEYPYRYGETHLNFGFVPGAAAGMRQLAQGDLPGADFARASVQASSLGRDLKSPANAELLIVFTDDGEQVRRWVEQLGRSGKPLIAGVSAAAAPVAGPYYESGQLHGMLVGRRGAAEYEGYLGRPASASATLDAISYVVIVLALAIGGVLAARLFARSGGSAA